MSAETCTVLDRPPKPDGEGGSAQAVPWLHVGASWDIGWERADEGMTEPHSPHLPAAAISSCHRGWMAVGRRTVARPLTAGIRAIKSATITLGQTDQRQTSKGDATRYKGTPT